MKTLSFFVVSFSLLFLSVTEHKPEKEAISNLSDCNIHFTYEEDGLSKFACCDTVTVGTFSIYCQTRRQDGTLALKSIIPLYKLDVHSFTVHSLKR